MRKEICNLLLAVLLMINVCVGCANAGVDNTTAASPESENKTTTAMTDFTEEQVETHTEVKETVSEEKQTSEENYASDDEVIKESESDISGYEETTTIEENHVQPGALCEELSNVENYIYGWYKSWGGEYEESNASLCTIQKYPVPDKSFYININDSRINISISEYDADGKWLKHSDGLGDGDFYTCQENTAYINVTMRSVKWGVDLQALFEGGLIIDLAEEHYMTTAGNTDLIEAAFTDSNNWRSGSYLYETGDYIIDTANICYEDFCKVEQKEYICRLPNSYLDMYILELDSQGTVLGGVMLHNGQHWVKAEETSDIAITITSKEKYTRRQYDELIDSADYFGLYSYVPYNHNTAMKDVSAWEIADDINVGWNLGDALDSKCTDAGEAHIKQELNWGNPYVTEELIGYVAECGFNTIRIPVTWYYNTYVSEDGVRHVYEEWLDRVAQVVDYAIANNLYVILNAHHEQPIIYAGCDEERFEQVLNDAGQLWQDIAEYFKDYDEHLIFEAYNEVDNLETSWSYSDKAAGQMNRVNQLFVDTVRTTGGNNRERILIVPTLLDGTGDDYYNAFVLPEDTADGKLMVEVHFYSKKFNQDIEDDFEKMEEFSELIDAPVIIGEWGVSSSYPLDGIRDEMASNYVARAAEHGIKCIWWDNNYEYGIINRYDVSETDKTMVNALIEGAEGNAYKLENETVLDDMSQFVYLMPNNSTGLLENKFWGTITTNQDGKGIKVSDGSYFSVSLSVDGEASGVWIQRILFYDKEGKLIGSGTEVQSKYYIGTVPEGAAYVRISFNSPRSNIAENTYAEWLRTGLMRANIHFFDLDDLISVSVFGS